MSEPPLPVEHFARLVAQAGDEELEQGLRVNREQMLTAIFEAMPARFDGDAAADTRAVIEWRITGREDGGSDRWQVTVGGGGCRIARDGDAQPDLVLTIGPVDFVRLAAGVVDGAELFVFGRIRTDGDLLLAARLDSFFRVPGREDPGD